MSCNNIKFKEKSLCLSEIKECIYIYFFYVINIKFIIIYRESETREIKSLDGFWDFYIPAEPERNDIEHYLDDSYYRVGLPYVSLETIFIIFKLL